MDLKEEKTLAKKSPHRDFDFFSQDDSNKDRSSKLFWSQNENTIDFKEEKTVAKKSPRKDINFFSQDDSNKDRRSKLLRPQNKNITDLKEEKTVVKKSPHKGINYSSPDDWIEVEGSKRDLFLYSAYYDDRQAPAVVRVIAIIKFNRSQDQNFSCQVWTKNANKYDGKITIRVLNENWGKLLYATAFLICKDFKLKKGEIAGKISIGTEKDSSLQTEIKIMHFPKVGNGGNFSVCVKPFHSHYNRAVWFVEFIELNRILGAQKFFFYKITIGEDMINVLKYYIKEGIVEVFLWSLPVKYNQELREYGIMAALNDCNLRSIGRYKHTIFIDVDEYILPRRTNNYHELIRDLGDYTSYVFQNAFFYLNWNNDPTASELLYGTPISYGTKLYGNKSEGPYLLTAYKTIRVTKPHEHNKRSKYIVKPEKVIECGNHHTWELIGKKSILNVSQEIALSHHYRINCEGGFECLKLNHTIDVTAHKWLLSLFTNVAQTCSEIYQNGNKCKKVPTLGSPK